MYFQQVSIASSGKMMTIFLVPLIKPKKLSENQACGIIKFVIKWHELTILIHREANNPIITGYREGRYHIFLIFTF